MAFKIGDAVRMVKVLSNHAESTKRQLYKVGTVEKVDRTDLYGARCYVKFDHSNVIWVRERYLEGVL